MTSESRTLIEPQDILGLEYGCTHCGVKHLIPLRSFDRGTPTECPNCRAKWIRDPEESKTLSYFVRCLNELRELADKNGKRVACTKGIEPSVTTLTEGVRRQSASTEGTCSATDATSSFLDKVEDVIRYSILQP
jgi:DNA-directed RNA polymerase subunit RPC12/RpoP